MLNRINPVSAQKDTIYIPQKVEVDEVEIIGQRTPGIYSEIARVITVISKDEISCSPVRSLNDLLEYLPNVDLRQRGPLGMQADIGIRGGSFDQTLILINGIPFNNPQTGHHNLNLPFDFSSIEKIEILEGPGSRIYGANAFSGAVNIVTRQGNEKSLYSSLTAGQHNYYGTNLTASYPFKSLSNFVSFSGTGTSGYADNTDLVRFSGYYRGGLQLPFGKLDIQAGYMNKAFGANSFYSAAYPDQFEQVKSKFIGFRFLTGESIKSRFYFSWHRHHDRFELFREDRYKYSDGYFVSGSDTALYTPGVYEKWNYYPGHNYHLTDVLTSGMNLIIPSKLGTSSLGFEYKRDHILSNVLGTLLDAPQSVPGEIRGQFSRSDTREIYSLFAGHTKKTGTLFISGGLLSSYNLMYGFNVFFGGEISKQFNAQSRLFLSANQSLRLPTFTDLYYNGPSNIGNPDLKAEKAVTIEGGYRMNISYINLEISAFNRFGRDIIDWVKLPDDAKYTTSNYTKLNTSGISVSTGVNTIKAGHRLNMINYFYLNYSYINTGINSGEYISAYILDYLKHKLSARISHKIYRSFNMSWNFSMQDRNGTFTDKDRNELDYNLFFITNARLYWKAEYIELFLEASNLFNAKYRDFGSVIQPGRWIFAGMSVNLYSSR